MDALAVILAVMYLIIWAIATTAFVLGFEEFAGAIGLINVGVGIGLSIVVLA